MNAIVERDNASQADAIAAPFFFRGKLIEKMAVRHRSRDLGVDFLTPELNLDMVVTPRSEPGPLFDVKISEIMDFLVELGERLVLERNPYLQQCAELVAATNPLPRRVVENLYRRPGGRLKREVMQAQLEANFRDVGCLDSWVKHVDPYGNESAIRAFPPRLIHMLAGNSPSGAVSSILQGALVKGVNLLKMPSSDPFSTVAVLRTMADIDPDHPVVRSFSAVYWRGGDEAIERTLYRPQYFDKLIAWGGGDAINSVVKYLGPGFQLISFDPKASISLIGREAWADDETMNSVAESTAADVTPFNQEACLASRFIFAEGTIEEIDRYCGKLIGRLSVDREYASAKASALPMEMREEIDVMQAMGEGRIWGSTDGTGLVIRSEQPVDFHPTSKTANVIPVADLRDALRHVNVATQTVGIFPHDRKAVLRDALASAGAQRIVRLGSADKHCVGSPHDGMYGMQRFVKWMVDEDA